MSMYNAGCSGHGRGEGVKWVCCPGAGAWILLEIYFFCNCLKTTGYSDIIWVDKEFWGEKTKKSH